MSMMISRMKKECINCNYCKNDCDKLVCKNPNSMWKETVVETYHNCMQWKEKK